MDVPDVKGLPQEQLNYLQELINMWRQEEVAAATHPDADDQDEDVVFTTQKSKVIGPLTRREIYDYL